MKQHLVLTCLIASLATAPLPAAEWLHWRGPEQNGVSRDTGLPDRWSPEGENLVWKQPFGGRSAPVVSRGRVYIINGSGQGINEQERVMCFDAKTGKLVWEHKFNIFHTDIVTNRVGWANLAVDPETGNVYAHGVQGMFFCFDPDGKILWSRSLTEEFGRITGYGGRIGSPIVDENLVIMNMLNASWGDQGRGGHRFVAFDKKTGDVVWWSEPGGQPLDTLYSVPVVTVINGQRLLICGCADGSITAMKVRTGEKVWSYLISKRGINTSPVVVGNRVYVTHSEENLDTTVMGGVYCFDAAKVTNGQPALLWRQVGILAGYASPVVHEGRLYVCDNSAKLFCLNADDGQPLWEFKYGTVAKASPVWGDGKLYVGEVPSKFHILEATAKGCKPLHTVEFPPGPGGEVMEINGSAAIADGRVFILTGDGLFCIATKNPKVGAVPPAPAEPNGAAGEPAFLLAQPADVVLKPGGSATFTVKAFDANGRYVKDVQAEWSLPQPPPSATPMGGTPPPAPPALRGEIKDGKLTVASEGPPQAGIVLAKVGSLTARARVRVPPQLPISQDFEKVPEGAVPGGWINVGGKFVVASQDGNKCLKKLANNPNPLLARANAYISTPDAKDYTIQADLMATEKRRNLPNMGIVNTRYTLWLDGNKQRLVLSSWEANHRLEKRADFAWKGNQWLTFKLKVTVQGDKALCQGKVWPRGEKEPDNWTVEIEDPIPNREGSPAVYAYAYGIPPDPNLASKNPGTEIFFDNIKVTPNSSR